MKQRLAYPIWTYIIVLICLTAICCKKNKDNTICCIMIDTNVGAVSFHKNGKNVTRYDKDSVMLSVLKDGKRKRVMSNCSYGNWEDGVRYLEASKRLSLTSMDCDFKYPYPTTKDSIHIQSDMIFTYFDREYAIKNIIAVYKWRNVILEKTYIDDVLQPRDKIELQYE